MNLVVCILFVMSMMSQATQRKDASKGSSPLQVEHVTILRRPTRSVTAAAAAGQAPGSRASGHVWVSEQAAQMLVSRATPSVDDPNVHGAAIKLKSLDATEYVGPIGVGTVMAGGKAAPQETLSVVFDTGSTNIWIASTLCDTGPCVNEGRKRFNPEESETYKVPSDPVTLDVKFGTAELKGPVAVDSFTVGPFTVQNQTFAMIRDEMGSTFAELPLEGIVGLGFSSMSVRHTVPFFDNVINQQVMKRNLFAFYLQDARHGDYEASYQINTALERSRETNEAWFDGGVDAILWGGIDERLYEGEMAWFKVTQAHYWSIDLKGLAIGDKTIGVADGIPLSEEGLGAPSLGELLGGEASNGTKHQSPKLIFDSGTMYYTADGALFSTLTQGFPANSCISTAAYPSITYQLEDTEGRRHDLTISQKDFMVSSDAENCELGFMQLGVPDGFGPAMILGELFMRKYFTVFDRGDGSDESARIGFARSKQSTDVTSLIAAGRAKGTKVRPGRSHQRAPNAISIDASGGLEPPMRNAMSSSATPDVERGPGVAERTLMPIARRE